MACFAGSFDAARLLIESGADVNAVALDDMRPLGFAVMKNNLAIVLSWVELSGVGEAAAC